MSFDAGVHAAENQDVSRDDSNPQARRQSDIVSAAPDAAGAGTLIRSEASSQPFDWRNSLFGSPIAKVIWMGALGGLLSCVYATYLGIDSFAPRQFLSAPLLGMGAAYLGVFFLANSDITNSLAMRRTLAFALICGFAWRAVYEAGSALVTQQIQLGKVEKLTQQMSDANRNAAVAPTDAASKTTELLLEATKVDKPAVADEATKQAQRVVDTLASEAPKKPEAAVALAQIAKTATETGNTAVASKAVDGLDRVTENQPTLAAKLKPELESIAKVAERKSMSAVAFKARSSLDRAAPQPKP
jgi:hypothetical protein